MNKLRLLLYVSIAGLASSATAQPVNPTPAAVPKPSLQQQFDAGSTAFSAGDWQSAYDIYAALEATLASRSKPLSVLPIVRIRKGQALYNLGQIAQATTIIADALPLVDEKNPTFIIDRVDALYTLARVDERRFDYPAAVAKFQSALGIADNDAARLKLYARLIPVQIFVDANSALADADAAIAIVARNPDASKDWSGLMRGLRGRVLTNMGRIKEARAELKFAVSQLGSIQSGRRIDIVDAAVRSDASIAAVLDKDLENGRLFLAATGSATASNQGFRLGVDMEPPQCGGANGPRPEDVAVVEFNINNDGRVGVARPVYFSGTKSVAKQFAEAVAGWFWTPESLAKLTPFFRAMTRLEMRCTSSFPKRDAISMLTPAVEDWLKTKAAGPIDLSARIVDKAALAEKTANMVALTKEGGGNAPGLIGPLLVLAQSPLIPFELALNYVERANAIAANAGAPPKVLAYVTNLRAAFVDGQDRKKAPESKFDILNRGLENNAIARDAEASAAMRLAYFDALDVKERNQIGGETLQLIVKNSTLADKSPYKVAALTRLANIAFNKGERDVARSLFERTGLTDAQCALVDAKPRQMSGSLTNSDFPDEAVRYSFGGWTIIEFDINATGLTENRRPVIAWPPFVFGEPAAKSVGSFRFEQSFRPGGGLGCGSRRQPISYTMPS